MTSLTEKAKGIAEATPDLTVVADQMPRTVTEAIARVMAELPAIGKDGRAAAQQGGYAYRGIEAITAEAQGLFGKYGVVFVPRVVSHEIKDITVQNKPWTDTILTVEYDVFGPGHGREVVNGFGRTIVDDMLTVGPLLAIGRDNSDKGANKAMTQAFKYALLQVLCISDKKDDGDSSTHEADARPEPIAPDPAAEEAMHDLGERIRSLPDSIRDTVQSNLRGRFGPSAQMTLDQIREAIDIVDKELTGEPSSEQSGLPL